MNGKLNVRLGNPMTMFFSSSSMLLVGIFVGAYSHPSQTLSVTLAAAAGVFAVLHELLSCFVWCSLSAWWVGRHTGTLPGGRRE